MTKDNQALLELYRSRESLDEGFLLAGEVECSAETYSLPQGDGESSIRLYRYRIHTEGGRLIEYYAKVYTSPLCSAIEMAAHLLNKNRKGRDMYDQTDEKPPLAKSETDSDIFQAAEARAEFWKYSSDHWTVSVELPSPGGHRSGRVIQVRKHDGGLSIVAPRRQ